MRYADELALAIFAKNPNLATEGDILNAAFPQMVIDLGSKKRANYCLNYDEDFAPDLISEYRHQQQESASC